MLVLALHADLALTAVEASEGELEFRLLPPEENEQEGGESAKGEGENGGGEGEEDEQDEDDQCRSEVEGVSHVGDGAFDHIIILYDFAIPSSRAPRSAPGATITPHPPRPMA